MEEYENIEYDSVVGEKEFYCSIDNKYTRFYCVEGSLQFETILELFGDHLEGDFVYFKKCCTFFSFSCILFMLNYYYEKI